MKPKPKPDPKSIQLGQKPVLRDISTYTGNPVSHPYGCIVNGRRYIMPSKFSQTGFS